MRKLFFLTISLTMVLFTGCSLHPVPENLYKDATVDIANSIYCETHHALKNQVIYAFVNSKDHRAKLIGEELKNGTAQPWHKHVRAATRYLDLEYRTRLDFFSETDAGFAFRFKIVEKNTLTGNAGFTLPFTTTTFTLGIDASEDKTRDNERRFRLVDNFQNILFSEDCADLGKKAKNYIYPITGSIGMDNVVQTFISLLIDGHKLKKSNALGHFSELLIFTTKFSAGVNPGITLGRVAKAFRLTSASASFDTSRSDLHQVQIVFTLKNGFDRKLLAVRSREAMRKMGIPILPVDPQITRQLDNLNTLQNDQRIIDRLEN